MDTFVKLIFMLHLIVGLSYGQDKIIFPEHAEDSLEDGNLITPFTIPERILIKMKDIQDVKEFLRFIQPKVDTFGDVLGRGYAGRGYAPPAPPTISKPANCLPEQQVVELEKPSHGAVLYWPSCVRLSRCGGCCTSKMLKCKPTATSLFNVTVLQVMYNPHNPDTFESQGMKVFTLEQHDRCACSCKQLPEDCSNLQIYRPDECRCICSNQEASAQCVGHKKMWDNSECVCKCRRIKDCSSGSYFNPIKCRCETLRRSLVDFTPAIRSTTSRSRPRY